MVRLRSPTEVKSEMQEFKLKKVAAQDFEPLPFLI